MATVGELVGKLELDSKDFDSGLDRAKGKSNTLEGSLLKIGAAVTAAVASFQAFQKVTDFMNQSVDAAANFQKSMTTLDIIAPRFGINAEKAKQAAIQLGKELKIGPGAAAEALQNLFKSGLNLPQATDMLRRFTNEAITGKSPSISLAQAVSNLSFAYTTGNSALGNLSGISENFIDITERGAKSMKMKTKDMNEAQLAEAKYRGMIELTNLTLGSSDKFIGTYIDTQVQLEQQFEDLKLAVGQGLMPIFNEFMLLMQPMISRAVELAKAFDYKGTFEKFKQGMIQAYESIKPLLDYLIQNQDATVFALGAIALAITATFVPALATAVATAAPVIAVIAAIGAAAFFLYKAWTENWGGMRDTIINVWEKAIKPKLDELWKTFNEKLKPAIDRFMSETWPKIQKEFEKARPVLEKIGEILGVVIVLAITQAIDSVTKAVDAFAQLTNFVSDNYDKYMKFANALNKIATSWGDLGKMKEGLHDLGVPGFADGTSYAPGGLAVVGEEGPELVELPRGSKVNTASETREMISGNKTINVYPVFNYPVDGSTFFSRLDYMTKRL